MDDDGKELMEFAATQNPAFQARAKIMNAIDDAREVVADNRRSFVASDGEGDALEAQAALEDIKVNYEGRITYDELAWVVNRGIRLRRNGDVRPMFEIFDSLVGQVARNDPQRWRQPADEGGEESSRDQARIVKEMAKSRDASLLADQSEDEE